MKANFHGDIWRTYCFSGRQSLNFSAMGNLPPAVSWDEGEETLEQMPREKIMETFKQHPILLIVRCVMTLVIAIIFALVAFFVLPGIVSSEVLFFAILVYFLILFMILIRFYISWQLNIVFFTQRDVGRMEHNGIFRQTLIRFRLDRIKSFDLEQKGFWQTILNSGDIHITSEMGSNEDIVLRSIWPAREAFYILRQKIIHSMQV